MCILLEKLGEKIKGKEREERGEVEDGGKEGGKRERERDEG